MITKIASYGNLVQPSVNNNRKNVSFTGLTDRMGKKIYNGFYQMSELFPKDKTKNPISGELPNFMHKKIIKMTDNIEGAAREIFDIFAKTSNELRDFEPTVNSTIEEMKNKRHNSTVKNLSAVLQKYKIISPWDDFDLKYIDKGGKGSVWKLDGLKHVEGKTEDEFVIKVFHTKSVQQNAYHGCYPEINSATYWMKNLGPDTNRGKFFWGDVNEAYMINKYIDEDVRLPKKLPNPYDYGVKFTDEDPVHIHNVCKKYSYDWGGGVVINQVVNSNKFARSVMHSIQNTPEKYKIAEWYKLYYLKTKGNYDSKFAGLALSIKSMKPENRVEYFEKCLEKRGKYTDRALGYTLKYLPYEESVKYYKNLAKSTNDKVMKKILINEIPLLSFKDECKHLVKDDLVVTKDISNEGYGKYIDQDRLKTFDKLAKEYKLTE